MARRIGCVAALGCLAPATPARADHHGMAMPSDGHAPASSFGAAVSLLAATFDTMTYVGDYQGVIPSARWHDATFAASASFAYYRLQENGSKTYGAGDLVAQGQATLVVRPTARAGVSAAVSAPTGNDLTGFGMGHVMAMPALWGGIRLDRVALVASAGYSRALAAGKHSHGSWPLVEPMNASELTWSASADLAATRSVHVGVRASGGIPVGSPGIDRVVGTLRAAWGTGRIETAAELQTGLAGDPFTIRGVVSTALEF